MIRGFNLTSPKWEDDRYIISRRQNINDNDVEKNDSGDVDDYLL